MILNYNDTIDNLQYYQNPNPDLKLEDASPYGDGLNALCFASAGWAPKECKLIVKAGGDHLLEIGSGKEGDTPLIWAIKSGAFTNKSFEATLIEKIVTLLELGANPNMANTAGTTPLWYAVELSKNLTIIRLLLEKRAFMHPMPSLEGKQRIKQIKIQLISEGKGFDLIEEVQELFKGKYEKKIAQGSLNDMGINIIKYLPEDVFYEIICKIVDIFINDECFPKTLKKDSLLQIKDKSHENEVPEYTAASCCCIVV